MTLSRTGLPLAARSTARPTRSPGSLPHRIEQYLLDKAQRVFEPLKVPGSDGDVEMLHQMRVSSRRLRVGLKLFSSLFPADELKQVLRQLQEITNRLGNIRELDVDVQLLQKLTRRVAPGARGFDHALQHVLLTERTRRLGELRQLMTTLEQTEFDQRVRLLIVMKQRRLNSRRLLKDSARQLDDLRRVVRKRYRRFVKKRSRGAFHKLRVAGKQYRYALEATEAVFQVKLKGEVRALRTLQDLMGAVHDTEVLLDTIQRHAEDDISLALPARQMVKILTGDRNKRFAQFEEFIHAKPVWTKKIKLTLPDA